MTSKTHTIPGLISHIGALLHRFFTIKLAVYSSSLRHFADNYRLPLIMTILFIVIIAGLAAVRLFERTSLIGLLPGVSGGGQGYSTLLISDEPDEFTRASTGETGSEDSQSNPSGSPSSFSISPGEDSSAGGGQTGNAAVFTASIANFQQDGVTLICTNPSKPNKGTCSKRYLFTGKVRTANGPGTVRYSWRSNLQDVNSSSSFSAGSGSNIKVLQKRITLACNKSSGNSIQLVLNSPTFTQSTAINFNHQCDDI